MPAELVGNSTVRLPSGRTVDIVRPIEQFRAEDNGYALTRKAGVRLVTQHFTNEAVYEWTAVDAPHVSLRDGRVVLPDGSGFSIQSAVLSLCGIENTIVVCTRSNAPPLSGDRNVVCYSPDGRLVWTAEDMTLSIAPYAFVSLDESGRLWAEGGRMLAAELDKNSGRVIGQKFVK